MPEQRTARPAGPRAGHKAADHQAPSSPEVYGDAMPRPCNAGSAFSQHYFDAEDGGPQ